MIVTTSFSVGSGIGPATCEPDFDAASIILEVARSIKLWS